MCVCLRASLCVRVCVFACVSVCACVCVRPTDAALVVVVGDAPQQLPVGVPDVGLDQSDQLVPVVVSHHGLAAPLPLLLQHAERLHHLVPFGPHQLPYLLLAERGNWF